MLKEENPENIYILQDRFAAELGQVKKSAKLTKLQNWLQVKVLQELIWRQIVFDCFDTDQLLQECKSYNVIWRKSSRGETPNSRMHS